MHSVCGECRCHFLASGKRDAHPLPVKIVDVEEEAILNTVEKIYVSTSVRIGAGFDVYSLENIKAHHLTRVPEILPLNNALSIHETPCINEL